MATYEGAIDALNSLQSNAATLEAIRKSGRTVNEQNEQEMTEYLSRIGHTRKELDNINVLHITGTKGKGSTAAFLDAILRAVRPVGTEKIGLYTSPHMVAARERIRIDGVPLSESEFARYFWEVWDNLAHNTTRQYETTPLRPMYFRFMTLLAFHVFISKKVSATLLEVGIGGLYDSTNIVQHPIATGVTALGLDHTALLGNTIEEIALQKAGIFKEGAPAFSTPQPSSAEATLEAYATKIRASSFEIVQEPEGMGTVELGLPGEHQRANASMAVALARAFSVSDAGKQLYPGAIAKLGALQAPLTKTLCTALHDAFWPGRCQRVDAQTMCGAKYYLDGAHTLESITFAVRWFVSQVVEKQAPRVFIFNCTNGRSGQMLLQTLFDELKRSTKNSRAFFKRVYFCTNNTYADGNSKNDLVSHSVDPDILKSLSMQQELAGEWCTLLDITQVMHVTADGLCVEADDASVHVVPSIEHAMDGIKNMHSAADVFVAGSLHLVGGVMAHLQAQGVLDDSLREKIAPR
ncbi:tetrahydrofolate synthase [Malassezia vespertilionis]|uniref:Folylpolyglutamate synthase n=1 Tax=Malassezia vespertilionis TaxID=2020962 RepID=A0A2N1JCY5_9BASI|nr:tetrahydrofolate synthase [Malassezia vespertilionis]PKI84403.1 Met7p [Malassezia vespertilionis]WFD06435.1 tetrahydrofolate synthase [Malassezia vespertilionis]